MDQKTIRLKFQIIRVMLVPPIKFIYRFANLLDNNDQSLKYSYNPCNTFKDVKSCDEVFVSVHVTIICR